MNFAKILFVAVAFAAGIATGQEKAPAGSVERGKRLYVELGCYSCHGTHGQGGGRGSEPKILPPLFPWEGFLAQMRKPRQEMPAYIEKWTSLQDVADIYAYLLALPKSPAAKDIGKLKDF